MIDKNGKRGHPTRRNDMITRKLKNNTAKIISRTKDSLTVKKVNYQKWIFQFIEIQIFEFVVVQML